MVLESVLGLMEQQRAVEYLSGFLSTFLCRHSLYFHVKARHMAPFTLFAHKHNYFCPSIIVFGILIIQ